MRQCSVLLGSGITAGENMETRKDEFDKEAWLWKTYGEGIRDALQKQPGRDFRLVIKPHRLGMPAQRGLAPFELRRVHAWHLQHRQMDAASFMHPPGPQRFGTTLERMPGLLLQLAGERRAALLSELRAWAEVAAARPPELEGFLAWAAELARMQEAAAGQAAAMAQADAALELVLSCAGRLPPAEAVRKDDLREAAAQLPGQLREAAQWAAAKPSVHAAALRQVVTGVAEGAVLA